MNEGRKHRHNDDPGNKDGRRVNKGGKVVKTTPKGNEGIHSRKLKRA